MTQYVYIFFEPAEDPKQNKVFYVGKGTGNRPKGHLSESGVSSAMRLPNVSDVPPTEMGARTENLLGYELQTNQASGEASNVSKVGYIQRLIRERRLGPKEMIRVIAQGLDDSMAETLEAFAIRFIFGKSNLTNKVEGKHYERFRSHGDWSSEFGQSIDKDRPYYVYVLMDPETKDVLYVGKGTGDRKLAHFKEAEKLSEDDRTRKHLALQTLQDQRHSPEDIARVIASNLSEDEAFAVESFALKYVYGHTKAANTNIVRGQKSFHFRAKDDWELRLGFDLPFLAAANKKKAKEMELDLMLGEAMDLPLLAVIRSFPELQWDEPRIVDSGELAFEAPVQVADGTNGGRIKVFIRGKGGIQVEFRAGTTPVSKWLLVFFSRLNYTNRRNDKFTVYFPDVWVNKPTPDLKEAIKRVRLVLALLSSNSMEELVQKVGTGDVAVLLSVDSILRAKIEEKRRKSAETRKKNAPHGEVGTEPEDDECMGGDLPKRESMPRWLHDWSPRAKTSMADFFKSRVVFYPGSGTDGQPVQFFGSQHAAHCFVCVDYGITRDHVLQELGESGHPFAGYRSAGHRELSEYDLTPNGWIPNFQPVASQQANLTSVRPYAFIEILERQTGFDDVHGPQRLAILFLCADGVAAYDSLFCQGNTTAPYAVVLQDHGFGGNWTKFGKGGALEQLAFSTERLPQLLLVATNTDVWPGYSAIDGAKLAGGGMHGFERQLWTRN